MLILSFSIQFFFQVSKMIWNDVFVVPQLGSPTGPKGVLSSLDGRLLWHGPAGSPECLPWFPQQN